MFSENNRTAIHFKSAEKQLHGRNLHMTMKAGIHDCTVQKVEMSTANDWM
jgi:hypothetical protein